MANNAQPTSKATCPDGYAFIFGNLCLKKTILDKAAEPLKELKSFDFTSMSCEAAVQTVKNIVKDVEAAVKMPAKYLEMAKALAEYPFDVAKKMVNAALGTIDKLNSAIDSMVKDAEGTFGPLKSACEDALKCAVLADSALGKTCASILDKMDKGLPFEDELRDLKSKLQAQARDVIKNVEKTPTESLANMEKAYNQAIERYGVNDLIKKLRAAEKCVESLCKAWKDLKTFQDRMPSSSSEFADKIGATIENDALKLEGAFQTQVSKISSDAYDVAHNFAVVKGAVN